MLKIYRIVNILEKILLIFLLILLSMTFFIRFKMHQLSNNLAYLDKKIDNLNEEKKLLTIELTYLTSTERLLSLIDNNPKILDNKEIIKTSQLKTKKQLIDISLSKTKNRIYENRGLAKNKTINDIIDHEI